jgi:Uma2 family endonuclease
MTYPVRTRRWTRKEYRKLGDLGIIHEDEPIELLDGHLIVAEPKTPPHATMARLTANALERAFGDGWFVSLQDPIALDDASEPEPDVAVVSGDPLDYLDDHPARPALLVEVAESSLDFDRSHKGSAYARAGLPDYWIVNLVDWRIEVYRDPAEDRSAELGWRYLDVGLFAPGSSIEPLTRPEIAVAVSDILREALRR